MSESPIDRAGLTEYERALRALILAGDEEAWRALCERHFDGLYAYLHCRTGRRAERTEEAAQECWLVAVRRIRDFDPERGSFEAWLRGIADNVLRALQRSWRREQDRIPAPEELPSSRGAAPGPERADDPTEEVALVLSALPGRYQAVLRLKYHEGLSMAEIARRSGETEKAVESLLGRARAAFREAFGRFRKETI